VCPRLGIRRSEADRVLREFKDGGEHSHKKSARNLFDEQRTQLLARLAEILTLLELGLRTDDPEAVRRAVIGARVSFDALTLENAEVVWKARFQSVIDEAWVTILTGLLPAVAERVEAIQHVEERVDSYLGDISTDVNRQRVRDALGQWTYSRGGSGCGCC
jgi:hypothetical protein